MGSHPLSAELQQHAHAYINRGWPVFLLSTDSSGGKVPPANCPECSHTSPLFKRHIASECGHLLCHGFYAATTDHDRFDKALAALPYGQLAIRTGQASRLLVIDAEAHSKHEDEPTGLDVLDNWESWVQGDWSLPETLKSRSVSGGLHIYLEIPNGITIGSGRILPNVDVKAEYGYVGAPSGQTARKWIDPSIPVAKAPPELLDWLQKSKRLGTGGTGPGLKPDGYDYAQFIKDGCPDGHRDFFFNDMCFRLRKAGTEYEEYAQRIWEQWERCAQPPDAQYYMPWDHVYYKLDRVWSTIDPDPPSAAVSWAHGVMEAAAKRLADAAISTTGTDPGNGELPPPPIEIGELDRERWYGANDDGTAARMLDMWGDWFRAIPRQRGGYSWIHYDGVIWQQDVRDRIWDAVSHLVSEIPHEVGWWEEACARLDGEGVQDWRTQRVGGNGQHADEFVIIQALRKYSAACKDNARKETGAKAFARRPEITISEEDLDAETRYLGLPDGRVLDVDAVHAGEDKAEWLRVAEPGMLLTKQLGCGYAPENKNVPGTVFEFSTWAKYLKDVLPLKTVRDTLQEIVGYALLGRPTEKIILLLHGPPDSGKTVLLEVLEALFGGYGGWTDGQALIAGKAKSAHSEWLNNIRGLRLVVTPETAKGAKIDAAWMKSYTGREPQTSRGAYGDRTVTWTPTGVIVNASNHYIEYDAEDTAVAERTLVIEFEQQFLRGDPRRDDQLPNKLKAELPVILNWALEGLRRHGSRVVESTSGEKVRSPQITVAEKIREWSKRYRTAQDHVGQFIDDAQEEHHLKALSKNEMITASASGFVTAKIVYALYRTWCRAQEIRKPLGRNTFNSHLQRVYGWQSVESGGKRWSGWTCKIPDEVSVEFVRW